MAKLLLIIPYEFYPPKFGGALRCFYLLKALAKENNVTLLTVQPVEAFQNKEINPLPQNIHIVSSYNKGEYKTLANVLPLRHARAINSRLLQKSLFKRGNLYLLKHYPLLKQIFKTQNFDAVIYENLECFSALSPIIKKIAPYVKHVYDAHNVDHVLWKAQAEHLRNPQLYQYSSDALNEESNLYNNADLCCCCSDVDQQKLQNINRGRLNIAVVPNGVDTSSKPFDSNIDKFRMKKMLFCGTLDYLPNQEGLLWFYEKVFPILKKNVPEIILKVVGKLNTDCGHYQLLKNDPAVDFIGPVEDVSPHYLKTSIAIVPLLKGSGTRLKIMEAMSYGNPVVSTFIGAEGLDCSNERDILIANKVNEFAQAIKRLMSDPDLFNFIRQNGRRLVVDNYDWEISGSKLNTAIMKIKKHTANN